MFSWKDQKNIRTPIRTAKFDLVSGHFSDSQAYFTFGCFPLSPFENALVDPLWIGLSFSLFHTTFLGFQIGRHCLTAEMPCSEKCPVQEFHCSVNIGMYLDTPRWYSLCTSLYRGLFVIEPSSVVCDCYKSLTELGAHWFSYCQASTHQEPSSLCLPSTVVSDRCVLLHPAFCVGDWDTHACATGTLLTKPSP